MATAGTASFDGKEALAESLVPELKRIARAKMRHERANHTLQPTELIGELYIRLLRRPDFKWKDRNHFLLYASLAMRHFLVDYAKEKRSGKRGGGVAPVELRETSAVVAPSAESILDVDSALDRLAKTEPRMAQVVELKFFGGLTFEEIGMVLGIHEKTAKRDWTLAREWLGTHLSRTVLDDGGRMGEN